MKILYVTGLWSGLNDVLFESKQEAGGMPAFMQPLNKIIKENNHLDLIVLCNKRINNKVIGNAEKIGISNITVLPWSKSLISFFLFIFNFIKVFKIIHKEKYDLVYGHGSISSIANIICMILRVPFGQRIYGTFLSKKLNVNRFFIFLSHPLEYLAFYLPKSFLIVTNDGTKGDLVFDKIKGKANDFYFILNGVNKKENPSKIEIKESVDKLIFYPARITRWKRQHLAIYFLSILRKYDFNAKLIFSGHISDCAYFEELKALIEEENLNDNVKYVGVLNKDEMDHYFEESIAVLSFYDISNLGNVTIEALTAGALVCSLDETDSLKGIVENKKNGLVSSDINILSKHFIQVQKDRFLAKSIRENAVQSSSSKFHSWEQRVDIELKIINQSIYSDK